MENHVLDIRERGKESILDDLRKKKKKNKFRSPAPAHGIALALVGLAEGKERKKP